MAKLKIKKQRHGKGDYRVLRYGIQVATIFMEIGGGCVLKTDEVKWDEEGHEFALLADAKKFAMKHFKDIPY